MYDEHEIRQVVGEFHHIGVCDLQVDVKDRLEKDVYYVQVKINDKEYSFNHKIDLENEKAQIKHYSKNDVYDALSAFTGLTLPWGSHTGVRPVALAHKIMETHGTDSIVGMLEQDYRISKEKGQLIYNIASYQQGLLSKDKKDIDIYISIPFCVSRCTYCSFSLIGIEKKKHLHSEYVHMLCSEIRQVGSRIMAAGYVPRCIYLGGGTPTAISPELLSQVLFAVIETFGTGIELTLEAGRPDTIDEKMLSAIEKFPISRININPQTMHQRTLDAIGRNHSPGDVVDATRLARRFGYSNINMDVIAGLPGESTQDFISTLNQVLELEPEGITVHTFALKRASRLKGLDYAIKADSSVSNMLEYSYKIMNKSGYLPYYLYRQKNMEDSGENVGFCKDGFACKYNVDIMDESVHILAMGSGGVSKRIGESTLVRRSDPKDIEVYIDRIENTIKESIEFFL